MITVVWRAPISRGAAPASVWSNHASSLHQGLPGTWHKPAAPRAQTIRYRHVRGVFRKMGTFGGCRGRRPVWGRRPERVADPARLRNKMHLQVIGVSPAMLSSRCTPISNSESCLWAMVFSQRIDVCMVCKCATFSSGCCSAVLLIAPGGCANRMQAYIRRRARQQRGAAPMHPFPLPGQVCSIGGFR